MPVHPGRALLGVPVRVDLDDMRTELAAGRFRDAKVGIEGSLPQARPELAVLGVVEGKVLFYQPSRRSSLAVAIWSPHTWGRGVMRGPTPLGVLPDTLELVWGLGGGNVRFASDNELLDCSRRKLA